MFERSCKMGKIAFVFSGQGAQYVGMGRDFYDNVPAVKRMYDSAEKRRPGTIFQSFEGDAQELKKTENTQPCLCLADLAAAVALKELGVIPDGTAGFSLGEIPALAFAGAFSFDDCFDIVCRRGELMGAVCGETGMAAVLKLDADTIEKVCRSHENVWPVNYNCPGQIVVSGSSASLEACLEDLRTVGARTVPLAVSGAFHSPFMVPASEKFGEFLRTCDRIRQPEIPVYSNETGERYGADIRTQMASQICHPVRWESLVRRMADDGYDTFIETGVGNTLKKFVEKILPGARCFAVSDMESAAKVKKELYGDA